MIINTIIIIIYIYIYCSLFIINGLFSDNEFIDHIDIIPFFELQQNVLLKCGHHLNLLIPFE